jgi:hypothetical protein
MFGPTTNWAFALCVGAAIIAFTASSRFDEPSYDSQLRAFVKYKPRFSTFKPRYIRAKVEYILAYVAAYLLFSISPAIFYALSAAAGADAHAFIQSPTVLPVGIALSLVALQTLPVSKDVDRRVRAFFHGLAQIPGGVRRSVALLRNSEYSFDPAAVSLQTRKLDAHFAGGGRPFDLAILLRDSEVAQIWYCTGCLLHRLIDDNRAVSIDPEFLDSYRDELDAIDSKHAQLTPLVADYLKALSQDPSFQAPTLNGNGGDSALLAELRMTRERLYTFIACGVRFSVNTELEATNVLRQLGFSTPYNADLKGDVLAIVGPIAGLFGLCTLLVSTFSGFSTMIFRAIFLAPLGDAWSEAFPVPHDSPDIYLWSWTTAFFYAAAVISAMGVRELRITKRQWFNINEAKRERPIMNYISPTVVGTVIGCVTLVLIALKGPGFQFEIHGISDLQRAVRLSFPWFPLAIAIAFYALWLSDSDMFEEDSIWGAMMTRQSVSGGLIMALIGFFTADVSVTSRVELFAAEHKLDVIKGVRHAITSVDIFIALQIAIFATLLCFVVQIAEFYLGKSRRLAGRSFKIVGARGTALAMALDEMGHATLLSAGEPEKKAHRLPGHLGSVPGGNSRSLECRERPRHGGQRHRHDFSVGGISNLRRL